MTTINNHYQLVPIITLVIQVPLEIKHSEKLLHKQL